MELNTPIRIYWDLTPAPPERPSDPLAVCAQILDLRVLALELLDAGPVLSRECLAILEALQGKPVAVTLTASANALEGPARERLHALGLKDLLVTASSLGSLRRLEAAGLRWNPSSGAPPGICFPVDEVNYQELPELLSFCLDNGIGKLVIPIVRAAHRSPFSYLDGRRREKLSQELGGLALPATFQLTIHDPFLWKVFHPRKSFPEMGCQAANTMLYIAPDATVYPCPALPFRLGSLGESSLSQIISSLAKRELRQTLVTPPAECRSCTALPQCLGGCRGRGYVRHATLDAADPACR